MKLFFLFFILFFGINLSAQENFDQYIQCRRDTEVRTLLPEFNDPKDRCIGTVIIQGISYECGKLNGLTTRVQEFFTKLKATAKSKCEDFCSARAKGCKGKFSAPFNCAFTIPEERALEYGKTQGKCSPRCSGQAFAYCSLYHAETLRIHEEFFQGKTPNCSCER